MIREYPAGGGQLCVRLPPICGRTRRLATMKTMSPAPQFFASILACAALAWPASAAADIYRFIDAQGVEHYTNVQPSGRGWQRIYRNKSAAARHAGPSRARENPGAYRARDPKREHRYDAYIREAATLYQLPEPFLRAVMRVESGFQPYAVSPDGAMGLMQLMPATAKSMGVIDAFEPRQNTLGGARFLRVLANRFKGDLVLTIAAYNAGQGAVERHGGVPPYRETRRYVKRILGQYQANLASEAKATQLARR